MLLASSYTFAMYLIEHGTTQRTHQQNNWVNDERKKKLWLIVIASVVVHNIQTSPI